MKGFRKNKWKLFYDNFISSKECGPVGTGGQQAQLLQGRRNIWGHGDLSPPSFDGFFLFTLDFEFQLKVCKFQKQMFLFSFEQKTKEIIFRLFTIISISQKFFSIFFLTLEKIGIDEKVICYHNISN